MKKWSCRLVPVVLASALTACGGGGSSSPAPTGVTASAGDGYIQVRWDAVPGVDYFVFSATDPSLTTSNWVNLVGAAAYVYVAPPLTLCAQTNGRQRWFIVNGRTGTAPGGPGSEVVMAKPRPAGDTWTTGAALTDDLFGIGFTVSTTCLTTGLATGALTAVGRGAAVYVSSDAVNWARRPVPADFSADLYAVANYTASPNATTNLGQRTIAVGAGGAALVSTDGAATWTVGRAYDASRATLRGIVAAGAAFVAAGDGGAIASTSDGITWNAVTSGTTTNLNGIGYGAGRYVAVGDGGTLVTSTDSGVTWSVQSVAGAGSLRAVAYGNNYNSIDNTGTVLINTFVAVGDGGTAVVSNDGGVTWTAQTIAGAGDLVSIGYTSRFVAIDRAGNAFTSANGQTWSAAIPTGTTGLHALAVNGYGYIAVGDGGVTATSF